MHLDTIVSPLRSERYCIRRVKVNTIEFEKEDIYSPVVLSRWSTGCLAGLAIHPTCAYHQPQLRWSRFSYHFGYYWLRPLIIF